MGKKITLICYTTTYRKGGAKFKRVAETMSATLASAHEVMLRAVNSKTELKHIFHQMKAAGEELSHFHFIGHSGMYGPMFGTVAYPEQFSPYEIKKLEIPFAKDAKAYFHCCRSARWFAPYFAKEQQVTTYGYHWYTTFSATQDYFSRDRDKEQQTALYCFGCPGMKSHGLLTSLKKYLGQAKAEKMKVFEPSTAAVDKSYDKVAEQYAAVFSDIRVRKDEYRWIRKHLPVQTDLKVLDIGCGNGALLRQLAPQISQGVGVDVSTNLLQLAKETSAKSTNLSFKVIDGPELPFADQEFDVVISMLSFRYLDWDPIMVEISRILKKEGQLLILDMVTTKVKAQEYPQLIWDKFKQYAARLKHPTFYNKLQKMVSSQEWKDMLKYNPIRSEHEMKWYLESRFPGRKVEVINVGMHSRIIAFDSIHMDNVKQLKLSYP